MTYRTTEIMDRGMACRVKNLGTVDAEYFISVILRERFDYTKWQRDHFDGRDPAAFLDAAFAYDEQSGIQSDTPSTSSD